MSVAGAPSLCSVHHLPVELLIEVIIYFCASSGWGLFLGNDKASCICPVLKVAAVFSSWRDLVLSTPFFWTRIRQHISRNVSLRRLECYNLLVNLALEHSRNAPLYLDLEDYIELDSDSVHILDAKSAIMVSLACHSSRWCHVALSLPCTLLDRMNPFIQNFLVLEYLELFNVSLPFDMVSIAPKLRWLNYYGSWQDFNDLRVPWGQLSELDLCIDDEGTLSEAITYLKRCPSLKRFVLGDFNPIEEVEGTLISSLESLDVSVLGCSEQLEQVLNSLTLPRLTELTLTHYGHYGNEWEWSDSLHGRLMDNFLMRSSCTLTSLVLEQINISNEDLISLLKRLPSIEKLSIAQPMDLSDRDIEPMVNITDFLLDALRIPHSSVDHTNVGFYPLLPKLKEVRLEDMRHSYGSAPSCEALIGFVESRWLPDAVNDSEVGVDCIRSVTFRFRHIPGKFDYDFSRLECLKEAGLDFTCLPDMKLKPRRST